MTVKGYYKPKDELQEAVDYLVDLPKAKSARERLFAFHESICREAYELMKRKNADYATEDDPLANFRVGGLYGIATRRSDKVVRDLNLLRKEMRGEARAVEDEPRQKTLLDDINYAIIELFAEQEGMKP